MLRPNFVTDADGENRWMPTEQELCEVCALAELRYPISKISLLLGVPIREFRRQMARPDNPVAVAYQRGKLRSERRYRETVAALADKGLQWAVEMMEKWDQEQTKEELGLHKDMI